jgi:hypothetical protein
MKVTWNGILRKFKKSKHGEDGFVLPETARQRLIYISKHLPDTTIVDLNEGNPKIVIDFKWVGIFDSRVDELIQETIDKDIKTFLELTCLFVSLQQVYGEFLRGNSIQYRVPYDYSHVAVPIIPKEPWWSIGGDTSTDVQQIVHIRLHKHAWVMKGTTIDGIYEIKTGTLVCDGEYILCWAIDEGN